MSVSNTLKVFGGLLRRAIAPTDNARPKIKSDKVSIRGLGDRGSSFKAKIFALELTGY